MEKYNLVLDLPDAFYEDKRFQKYFDYFESKANVKHTHHATAEDFHEDLGWADAIIMWTFPEFLDEDFKYATHLKYLGKLNSTRQTVEAAHRAGVQLSDMRGCYSLSVAELALGHILNVYRNISGYVNDMRNGTESWVIKAPIEFPDRDRELSGQKVGIIGFGGVGQHLSRFLKPFTDDIIVSDPYIPQEVIDQYGVKKGELKDIFSECDVIVSCAANNTATEKLINKELIDSIKPGALFMNMGRAILVDNEALLERIRKHDIYVVMDVFEVEPLPKDHEFRKHENVYMTTHRGGTLYSFYQIFDNFVEDLEGVMERGEEAKWPVKTTQLHALRDYK